MMRSAKHIGTLIGLLFASVLFLTASAHGATCGVQTSPDGLRVMANRDVGAERWAITRHPSGIVTGNVFRADGGAPAFVSCEPGDVPNQYLCMGGDGCLAGEPGADGTPRAVSVDPLAGVLLVNKSVGPERWAITENEDGTLTGNVFSADGSDPAFIFCEPNGAPDGYTCFGAESCVGTPCGSAFSPLGDVTLPAGFLARPVECDDAYEIIGNAIQLPDDLFRPEGCIASCGNGIRDVGELCDGADDDLCPGQCSDACACPSSGALEVFIEPGSSLDAGWTGSVHGLAFQRGTRVAGKLTNCDGQTDPLCDFFADVGSFCSGDPSRACTNSNQCSGAGSCIPQYFGPPLPLEVGGVPACILIRNTTDAVGTYDLDTGDMTFSLGMNALAHLSLGGSDPCPVCDCGAADPQDCEIGDVGTCGGFGGGACTVDGTGLYGPTSLDCLPSASSNVTGGGIQLVFDTITTDTLPFAATKSCDGGNFQDESCWCDGQLQPNNCGLACDGGSNDTGTCSDDAQCPGGSCVPLCRQLAGAQPGRGECVAGPIVQTCAGAPQTSCSSNGDCPAGTGPCSGRNESCYPDPLVLEGTPGTTSSTLVASACVPSAGGAMDTVAGLPGPAALNLPATISVAFCGDGVADGTLEQCDGDDDAACPGACSADCTCAGSATCGNDVLDPGEQCDGTADTACPGLCSGSCECEGSTVPPACGNGVIDPGETCEFPGIGCGPFQVCFFCNQCFPPDDLFALPLPLPF